MPTHGQRSSKGIIAALAASCLLLCYADAAWLACQLVALALNRSSD
jgi:hypothetical protein